MSWLSTLTSAEGAAALLKSAVSKVESQIDKVLDIPQSPNPARSPDASASTLLANSTGECLAEQPVRHQPNWDKLSQKSNASPRPGQRKGKSPRASSDSPDGAKTSTAATATATAGLSAPPQQQLSADDRPSSLLVKLAGSAELSPPSTDEPAAAKEDRRVRRKQDATKRLSTMASPVTASDIQATSRADDLVQPHDGASAPPNSKEEQEEEEVAAAVAAPSPTPIEASDSPADLTMPVVASDVEASADAESDSLLPSTPATSAAEAPTAPPADDSSNPFPSLNAANTNQFPSLNAANTNQIDKSEPSAPSSCEGNPLQAVLDRREEQLIKAMHENASLTDTLTALKRQLELLEDQRSQERGENDRTISNLHAAAAESEKRFAAMREVSSSQSSLQASFEEAMRKLGQKEELAAQLMLEGERLSKAELKFNMTIKRLRAEKVDADKERKADAAKIEKLEAELTTLKGKVAEAVDSEKKHADSARTLSEAGERHAKEVKRLQGELDTALKAQNSLQSELDAIKAELADSRKGASDASAAAKSEALDEERRTVASLRAELAALQKDAEHVQGALTDELQDLRRTIAQKEDEAVWKEDTMRREIASLQHRLQDVEAQNHELAVAGNESAQPLLRQIELLQAQHAAASRKWETIERQLTLQLQGAERHQTRAADLERDHAAALAGLTAKLDGLRAELATSHASAHALTDTVAARDAAAVELQTRLDAALGRITQLEDEHRMVQSLSNQNEERLRRELDEERRKLEERSKSVPRLPVAEPETPAKEPSPVAPVPAAPTLKIETARQSPKLPPVESRRASSYANSPSSADLRLSDLAAPNFNTGAAIERLTATVRHYEGQLSSMRVQLEMAEQGRNDLAEELVVLHEKQDEAQKLAEQVQGFRAERDELNTRYVAALELLGEKTERVQELQADIADMKGIFKQQLSDMMRELDAMRARGGG
ncbi:hypothetical protein HDU87_001636 [Geranomyces variabilis]|uniref:TATA element modulatory factor 1 TATA binding domain-containing protein n=1 Tax=Geranomyces variabilis TaxID=109894 RepID=A0AAD5TMH1_9FUNG|nr:hypothetical protein HDU87_001636 [Geranomyces variabilis]